MSALAANLFREVRADFFRVLASPLAGLYVDVLDVLEHEAVQRNHGLDRGEALALVEQVVELHGEIAGVTGEAIALAATLRDKARVVLETLRNTGWLLEEERSDWQRLIYFDPNGVLLLQTLRKIAFPGRVIQTDDGTEWRHDLDLSKITSVCHRRTAAGLEFAVVECLPLKSGELKSVLNSGHNVREMLQTFMRDQRQVLNLWKDDVKAQVREHLDEKYPHQDMGIVVESFEIKMARAISETRAVTQSQSHGIRV